MFVGTGGTITPNAAAIAKGAVRAEASGYRSMWWPDHLMGWFPPGVWSADVSPAVSLVPNPDLFVDPVPAMTVAATATESLLVGTAVTDVVHKHPATLARELLTMEHMTGGRTIFGVGAGERENIGPYGIDNSKSVSRLEETLRLIRALWSSQGAMDFDGEFFTLKDAVLGLDPLPAESGGAGQGPPIWLGAHGPRMLDLVGSLGDGWLPTYDGNIESWLDGKRRIDDAAAAAGRNPRSITAGLWVQIIVDEDEGELDRLLAAPLIRALQLTLPASVFAAQGHRHPFGDDFGGFRDYVPSRVPRAAALAAFEAVPPELARTTTLCGTPDEIVAKLRSFEAVGLDHVVLVNATYWGDPTKLRSSMQLQDEIAANL